MLVNVQEFNPAEYWNPKLYVDNTLGKVEQKIYYKVSWDKTYQAWIHEVQELKGQFGEQMELYHFPFDRQVIAH